MSSSECPSAQSSRQALSVEARPAFLAVVFAHRQRPRAGPRPTEGDHCLNHVEPWVAQHQGVLSALLGKPILPSDAHDDRLADLLNRLSEGTTFASIER